MLSIELAGGYAAAQSLVARLELVANAVSLGGVESLAVHAASVWEGSLSIAQIEAAGCPLHWYGSLSASSTRRIWRATSSRRWQAERAAPALAARWQRGVTADQAKQLFILIRFAEIVIHADLTRVAPMLVGQSRGDRDDRQLGETLVGTDVARQIKAVHAWHLDIGEDHVRNRFEQALQRIDAVLAVTTR